MVFCCFNNSYKILPPVFARWMRILLNVSRSVLWLSRVNPLAVANLKAEAVKHGVDANRLIFAEHLVAPADHLARLGLADLFLDTQPYNAHATALDALWAGLPLLTWRGTSFAGRVGASLLTSVKLPELIAESGDEYETLAIDLALNPPRLARIREKLSSELRRAPLFDIVAYTRALEAGYEAMLLEVKTGSSAQHAPMSSSL
jgi:predicted O-linked N-acetylglucosamine transferase (SPINDLY family)